MQNTAFTPNSLKPEAFEWSQMSGCFISSFKEVASTTSGKKVDNNAQNRANHE